MEKRRVIILRVKCPSCHTNHSPENPRSIDIYCPTCNKFFNVQFAKGYNARDKEIEETKMKGK